MLRFSKYEEANSSTVNLGWPEGEDFYFIFLTIPLIHVPSLFMNDSSIHCFVFLKKYQQSQ